MILTLLPDHHGVALEDTVDFKLKDPYTFKSCTVKRSQIPIQPGFIMTAYKAQGRTLLTAVVRLSWYRGIVCDDFKSYVLGRTCETHGIQ
jgi:hypothetical protein